jgi:hypothetical protein
MAPPSCRSVAGRTPALPAPFLFTSIFVGGKFFDQISLETVYEVM